MVPGTRPTAFDRGAPACTWHSTTTTPADWREASATGRSPFSSPDVADDTDPAREVIDHGKGAEQNTGSNPLAPDRPSSGALTRNAASGTLQWGPFTSASPESGRLPARKRTAYGGTTIEMNGRLRSLPYRRPWATPEHTSVDRKKTTITDDVGSLCMPSSPSPDRRHQTFSA